MLSLSTAFLLLTIAADPAAPKAMSPSTAHMVRPSASPAAPSNPAKVAELAQTMREVEKTVAAIPMAERKARQRELLWEPKAAAHAVAVRDALMLIALRPQDVRGAHALLHAHSNEEDKASALEYVLQLYRSRSGTATEAEVNWQSGYAELLMIAGRFEEALPLDRLTVQSRKETYPLVRLALLELVHGDPDQIRHLMAHCPGAPDDYEEPAEGYCRDVAFTIIERVVHFLGPRTPQPLARMTVPEEILNRRAASPPKDPYDLRRIMSYDKEVAEAELRKLLADRATPAGVRVDVLEQLALLAGPYKRPGPALELMECWIRATGVIFPPLPSNEWTSLAALPPSLTNELDLRCNGLGVKGHTFTPADPCVVKKIWEMASIAMVAEDWPRARVNLERAAAIVLLTGEGKSNLTVLLDLYARKTKDENVARYVEVLKSTAPGNEVPPPWPSPTLVDAPTCP